MKPPLLVAPPWTLEGHKLRPQRTKPERLISAAHVPKPGQSLINGRETRFCDAAAGPQQVIYRAPKLSLAFAVCVELARLKRQ